MEKCLILNSNKNTSCLNSSWSRNIVCYLLSWAICKSCIRRKCEDEDGVVSNVFVVSLSSYAVVIVCKCCDAWCPESIITWHYFNVWSYIEYIITWARNI
jgi:hypothetical protein